jgi:glycosyltransferase involved in cell wall biosynthesis
MISRLVLDKGVIEYIEAAEKISKEFKNIRFILIGERDKDAPLRISDSQYKKLLNSSVEYKGYKNSINSELKKHNVFVLPSYHEGLSVSSMEAASSGLSLLLSDITGCKEIVIEGHNGFTFKPKSTESLYLGMKKIIGNKNKLDLFGRNSRKLIIEKFSKEIIIKKMNFIYEELK